MEMTVKELARMAERVGMEDEEAYDFLSFVQKLTEKERRFNAMCGMCGKRKTLECRFASRAELAETACRDINVRYDLVLELTKEGGDDGNV